MTIDNITHSHTSSTERVRIEVEPKRVPHTSPPTLEEDGKMFSIRYPIARAPTEAIARIESPAILVNLDVQSIRIAHIIIMGKTTSISLFMRKTVAKAKAPKATWDNPSPINEYLFRTNITPKRDAQRAIKMPVIKAYLING